MNRRTEFTPHIVALSCLFVMGNGILYLPSKGADGFTFLAFLISLPILCVVFWLASFIWNSLNKTKSSHKCVKKAAYIIWLLSACVFALFSAGGTFSGLVGFASDIMLPETPRFFIVLLLGVTVLYFSFKNTESILKFALISGVLTAVVMIFFFAASVDRYDLRNIFILRLPKIGELFTQLKPYLINLVLQAVILPVFLIDALGNKKSKGGILGITLGWLFLGIGVLASVLLFSPEISGELSFPFSSAVSTVTVGRLFTRLDGFAYFVYFVCGILKTTVCVGAIRWGLKQLSIMVKGG